MRNRLRLCAVTASLLAAVPATATAQRDVFVDAFIALHSALPGTYGDEGAQITSEYARLTAARDAWDRSAAAAEAELKKRSASPGEFALHYVDQQRLEAAIEAMHAAIAAEPGRVSLHLFQGQLFEATGRMPDAQAAYRRARQLDPDDPIAAYFVATRSPSDKPDDLEPFVATLLASGDRRRALPQAPFAELRLVRDLSAPAPAFAPAVYVDAFNAFSDRRFREALDLFRVSIARDPLITDPAAQSKTLLAGVAALRAKDGAKAVTLLENAVKSSPESSESRRVLGIVYRAVGKLPESIAQFELAVRLRPDDERARVALGTTLTEAGKLEEAERELRDTIRLLPASGSARWALVDVLDKQSRGTEAIQLLEDAATLPVVAGRARLLWRIAELAHSYKRDSEHVIAVVSQMARLTPNEAGTYKDLGLAYYRVGRDSEAAIQLLMMAILGHEDAEALGALGQIHLNAGRLDRATPALRRAVALDPTSSQARYVLARTLQRLGRNDEANQELAEFNKLRATMFDEQRLKFESDVAASTRTAQ